jgi:hypothetical protein
MLSTEINKALSFRPTGGTCFSPDAVSILFVSPLVRHANLLRWEDDSCRATETGCSPALLRLQDETDELFHFHLLLDALADEKFVPENIMEHEGRDFAYSVRTALLSWYCTIVDRTAGGLNIFNVWRELFPNHRDEIERVRAKVEPDWEILKNFRDKCGFHADTPRNYFLAKQKLLDNLQVVKSMQEFLDLAKKLIKLEDTELIDFVPEVETTLLEGELEGTFKVNRNAMKRLLILPHGNYKKVFG